MPRVNVTTWILWIVIGLTGCRTQTRTLYEEEHALYSEALDQIIDEYFISHCLHDADVEFAEKMKKALLEGRIDSGRYYYISDSLVALRKTQSPKCLMEVSSLLEAALPIRMEDMQSSMAYALEDDFFKDYFNSSKTVVIDTLLENGCFDWEAISLPYLELVPHDTSDHAYPYGKTGVGVIALSKVYFNQEADHAILFFEFKSSANFQRGEIVFLKKTKGYWKAVGFRNIWIT